MWHGVFLSQSTCNVHCMSSSPLLPLSGLLVVGSFSPWKNDGIGFSILLDSVSKLPQQKGLSNIVLIFLLFKDFTNPFMLTILDPWAREDKIAPLLLRAMETSILPWITISIKRPKEWLTYCCLIWKKLHLEALYLPSIFRSGLLVHVNMDHILCPCTLTLEVTPLAWPISWKSTWKKSEERVKNVIDPLKVWLQTFHHIWSLGSLNGGQLLNWAESKPTWIPNYFQASVSLSYRCRQFPNPFHPMLVIVQFFL